MTYKLIALDLDGTLLNSSLKLSDVNAEALRAALDRGAQVVLATSRWYGLAKRTAVRVGVTAPLICSNGAVVRCPESGRELLHLHVDPDAAAAVTALGDDRGWEMFTTVGEMTYMRTRPGIIPEKLPPGLLMAERQSDLLSGDPATCVLVFGDSAVREIERQLVPKYGEIARFSLNRPLNLPHYVVLTHPLADKASALELVCKELGTAPGETIAMGDSESDVGMLRWAGLGIAMMNSPEWVKLEADEIAPANDEDGVAWAVRKFFP